MFLHRRLISLIFVEGKKGSTGAMGLVPQASLSALLHNQAFLWSTYWVPAMVP